MRSHVYSSTSSENRLRPVPSTQLNVKQVERELLLRERRRNVTNPKRNWVNTKKTISKPTDTHFTHNFTSKPHIGHRQFQERSCSNCNRPIEVNKVANVEPYHPSHIIHLDACNSEPLNSNSLSQPHTSTNNLNLNAQRIGRPRKRAANLGAKERTVRGRVGRPRKAQTNVDYRVMSMPLRPVIKFSSKRRMSDGSRHRSRSRHSCLSSVDYKESRTSSQEDSSSDRGSSPSRYQVTPYPQERHHASPGKRRRESVEPKRSFSSRNRSYNNSPGEIVHHSSHLIHSRRRMSRDGSRRCRCDQHEGRKYQRSAPHTEHNRKRRPGSREGSAEKRRHPLDAKTRGKTIIERVKSAWSSPNTSKKRNKRDTKVKYSGSSSESDRHREKRHKSRDSRSESISDKCRHQKSSKQKSSGSYLICRLM